MGTLFLFGPRLCCELYLLHVSFSDELQLPLSGPFLASCMLESLVPSLVRLVVEPDLVVLDLDLVGLDLDPVVPVLVDLDPELGYRCSS